MMSRSSTPCTPTSPRRAKSDHQPGGAANDRDVEAIDRIREAGRNMASNNDGTYEALRTELADALAAVNNI